MKKEKINITIIFLLFSIIIFMFTSVNTYNLLDNYMIYIFLFFTISLLIVNFKRSIKTNYKFILILLSFFIMIVSIFTSFGGIGSFLGVINFIILIYLSNDNLINDKQKKYLNYLILIFYFLNVYLSLGIWNNYISQYNVINPNTIAINLLYTNIMLSTSIESSSQKHKRTIILLLSIITSVFIINCHCRNALIALWIFFLIIFFPGMKRIISSHISIFLWLVIIVGIMTPILYSKRLFVEIPFFSQLSDKSIYSGRDIIWKYMLLALSEKKYGYLIGLGSRNLTNIGIINNYHTWYLGVIYMYGIPIFLSYFYYLISRIKKLNNDVIKIGFLSIFITGIFETSAIWMYVQFLIFILILLDNSEKTDNKISK